MEYSNGKRKQIKNVLLMYLTSPLQCIYIIYILTYAIIKIL